MHTRENLSFQRRLTAADADAAVEVMARAFVNDPLWRFLFPDATQRTAPVRQAFRTAAPSLIATFVALMTPENVPLYEHYGFVVREELLVPASGLRIWALQRLRLADNSEARTEGAQRARRLVR